MTASPKPTVNCTEVTSPNAFYFECHRPEVVAAVDSSNHSLIPAVAGLIADYVIKENAFGTKEWAKHWATILPNVKLFTKFYEFWFGRDRFNPSLWNCDTHLPPVLQSDTVQLMGSDHAIPFCLEVLGRIIQTPRVGRAARFAATDTEAYLQNRNTRANGLCWLVFRKQMLARGQALPQQIQTIRMINLTPGVRYEECPLALDLATAVAARHVSTPNGERYLGDETGMESQHTTSFCSDVVRFDDQASNVSVGLFSAPSDANPATLHICDFYDDPDNTMGVTPLCKLGTQNPQ